MTGSGVTLDTVRHHVAMWLDQAWVLGRHHLGRAVGWPEHGSVVPFDGSVRLAIVVVNFSTTRYLKLLLLTMVEQSALGLVHRIVVVDNGSVDGGLPFLRHLASRSPRVELVERRHLLEHARGLRAGVSRLRVVERNVDATDRCNVYLFCDPDLIFRSTDTLQQLSERIVAADAALLGEWRGGPDDPDIQASFLAVRSDAYARADVVPPVHHGSPTRWMQRSIARAGDLAVAQFASNHGGFVLHRGRSATPGRAPHFMGVTGGAGIWTAMEARLAPLLAPGAEPELLDVLVQRLDVVGTGPAASPTGDLTPPVAAEEPFDLSEPLAWAPDLLQRSSLGAVLVLRPPGEPLRLSGFAPVLWPMFEQPASPADVASAVVDAFGVDPATARDGVAGFVRPLVAHGALHRVGPSTGRRPLPFAR